MFRKLILLIVTSIAIFSTAVFAVGLGESKLQSGINQPLKAEISLLSVADLSEHELQMSLATTDEFDKVGVEFLYFLNDIRFKTVRDAQGRLVINLTSREPIKEPFLNFVVALNYPKGRFVKEYTFLLDPPVFTETVPVAVKQTQSTKVLTKSSAQVSNNQTRAQTSNDFTGSTYGAVSANDTLWGIANKVRPNSDVTIHQTLVAIYRANPNAFSNGNINNLLRGEVLQIPDADTISKIPQRAALKDIVVQNKQWKSGGARKIVENTSTQSQIKTSTGEARLSLATQDSDYESSGNGSGGNNTSKLNDELARSQERSATLQAENEELRSRLNDLLEKVEKSNGSAINIADTELAALTQAQKDNQSTTEINASSNQNEDGLLNDSQSEVTDTNIVDIDESSTDSINQEANSEIKNDTLSSENIVNNEKAEITKEVKKPVPVVVPPPEKSFIDEMLDSGYFLGGVIGVILLIVIVVFWRMRKRMQEEDFQDDLVASAGAGSMDNTEEFELPDVGDDMLVELDMDDDEHHEPKDENFDPLGEADIYIAYGKFEQAESLLLESIISNPNRSDLKVKLMECYAENENKDKFDRLADEVTQSSDGDQWVSQINKLREQTWMKTDSDNDEFDLPSTEDIFGEESIDLGMGSEDLDNNEELGIKLDDEQDFNLGDADDIADPEDFSLDDDNHSEEDFSIDALDDEEFDLDMDVDLGLDDAAVKTSAAVTETFNSLDDDFLLDDETSDSEDILDLDEDVLEGDLLESDVLEDAHDSLDLDEDEFGSLDSGDDLEMSLDDDSFDLDDNDDEFADSDESTEDEVSTKLDLARAYIDMGDSDGAKDILEEVIADGNESQKSEARALLEKAD